MKFTNQRSPVIGTPEREFFMVNLIVSESYYPDLDMIFLLLDQLDKPKLIYYRDFFMVNLFVSESYYPDLDTIFLFLDQLDKPKLIYYRCELPFFHTYIPLSQILENSHNNLQHTFKSKLFQAYAVEDLLNYPFSTRKLKNNTFKITHTDTHTNP